MGRILAILALMITASPRLSTQNALVVELSKEDSVKAAELYQRLSAAQAEWEAFRLTIRDKYGPIVNKTAPRDRQSSLTTRDRAGILVREIPMPSEWAQGITFSPDFRFAVPAKQ